MPHQEPLQNAQAATANSVDRVLSHAPPAHDSNLAALVIGAGLLTTALTLIAVFYIAPLRALMGVCVRSVPVGMLIVAMLAGSGYGIASWFTGFRICGWLMWTVLTIQSLAYVGGHPENHAGALGYARLFFDAAVFVIGAMAVPGALIKQPYCDSCLAYMNRMRLAQIRASAGEREVNRSDAARTVAYADEQYQALRVGLAELAELEKCAGAGEADKFKALLPPAWKEVDHLPCHIKLFLSHCRRCGQGRLQPILVTGQKERTHERDLPATAVSADFVRALLAT